MRTDLQAEEAVHDVAHSQLGNARPPLHHLPQRAVRARQDGQQALPVLRGEGHLQGHTLRMSLSSLRWACRSCQQSCPGLHVQGSLQGTSKSGIDLI